MRARPRPSEGKARSSGALQPAQGSAASDLGVLTPWLSALSLLADLRHDSHLLLAPEAPAALLLVVHPVPFWLPLTSARACISTSQLQACRASAGLTRAMDDLHPGPRPGEPTTCLDGGSCSSHPQGPSAPPLHS